MSLIFARHARDRAITLHGAAWYTKHDATFGDAITSVRRLFWETVLKQSLGHTCVTKLPPRLRLTLPDHLSRAA